MPIDMKTRTVSNDVVDRCLAAVDRRVEQHSADGSRVTRTISTENIHSMSMLLIEWLDRGTRNTNDVCHRQSNVIDQ
jgi:hypothetical protein